MGDDKKERGRPRTKTGTTGSNVLEEVDLTNLNDLVKKVITKIENLTKIVEHNAKSCDESFKAFEFAQGNTNDKLDAIVKDFETLNEENKRLKKDNAELKKTVNGLAKKIENFDMKFEMMERNNRKSNLCIDGVVEREGLSLIKLVSDLFRDLEINLKAEEVCHAIYRKGQMAEVGNGVKAKPRPIIVEFKEPSVKRLIFKNMKKLAGNNTWLNVFINDDLTPDQINKMKDMRAIHYYARSLGKQTKLSGSNLWIEDKKYNLEEIDQVPAELSIKRAKNIKTENGKSLVFQGHHSCLSNMSEAVFVYEGREFTSSEIAYQSKRAEESKQPELAEKIRKCQDAYKAKRLSRGIKDGEKWNDKKEKVMKDIVKVKFTQNEKIKASLIETRDMVLCEGTGDRYWGCGIPISKSSQIDSTKLPGKNKLGKILMEVRNELRKK